MKAKSLTIWMMGLLCVFSASWAFADCPSADLTGDCFVDFEDFAVTGANWPNSYDWNDVNTLASQWLTTDPCVPDHMVYIPDGNFVMGDHFYPEGDDDEVPLHGVLLDAFFMSKYQVTNQQYCDYLNSALGTGIYVSGGVVHGVGNTQSYCDTSTSSSYSQIDYNEAFETFNVRTKGTPPRDMSDDPMVRVNWYGSVAYCNWRSQQEGYESCYDLSTWDCNFANNGYRLPTEAEWEYAARGGLSGKRFPWADPNITHSLANYRSNWEGGSPYYPYDVSPTEGYHPDWNDVEPYTSPVGSFADNGFGLYDMAGNVWEWCNDFYDYNYYDWCKNTCAEPCPNPTGPASDPYRVLRGGSWYVNTDYCRVASRDISYPAGRGYGHGFRIVLDLD